MDNRNDDTFSEGAEMVPLVKDQNKMTPVDETVALPKLDTKECVRIGDIIRLRLQDLNSTSDAEIVSRAGKATGKYKNWYNVQYLSPDEVAGTTGSLNLQETDYEVLPAHTVLLACERPDPFSEEKLEELTNWKHFDVYDEVPFCGEPLVTTRWVCTEKEGVRKARLVARGFEDRDLDSLIKESPTCSRDSLRTILAIYPTLEWEAGSLDIKAAFLQGSDLTRQVFIKPPREAHSECVWKLKKAVYGLCDAPRLWFERPKQVLLSVDCIQSEADECIFLYVVDNSCNSILALHVDDIFWSGSPIFQETVLGHVHDKFLVKSSTSFPLRYLGLDISFENKVCQVNMTEYARSLQEVSVPSVDDPKSPADESLISKCRAVIGKLLWIAVQTAPYISY